MQFQIDKMGCGGCAKTITNAIHSIDPAAKIGIDLVTKRVDITTDVDQATMHQALSRAGFPPLHIG